MSDYFYAAQFRSMHTAIHNVAVFSLEERAREFLMYIEEHEEMPSEHEFDFDSNSFVDMYEIDYRNPPYHWSHIDDPEAVRLIIINEDEVKPDVYGY